MSKQKRIAVFTDYVRGTVNAVDHRIQSLLNTKDAESPTGHSLLVKIAATHAALQTSNKGFYLPEHMRNGAPTFLTPYPKPVLTHHDDFKDPIGRVQAARYVDLTHLYPVTDEVVRKLATGGLEYGDELKEAVQYMLKNYDRLDTYQGLGYIEVVAEVTDPDSIQKILDKRYLTVSTAHSSDAAHCSVCMQNWVEDGWCDHEPGGVYEDERCVLLPGQHKYSELSYVNKPADRHASTIDIINDPNLESPENRGFGRISHDQDEGDDSVREVDMGFYCKGPACIYDLTSEAQISLTDAEGPLEEVIQSMSDKAKEQEIIDLLKAALEDTSKDLPEELVKDKETILLAHSMLSISCCDKEDAEYFDIKVELSKKLREKAGEMEIEELEDNEVELQAKAKEEADAAAAAAAAAEADAAAAGSPAADDQTADAEDGQAGDAEDGDQDADQELLDLTEILETEKSYELMKEHIVEDNRLNKETMGVLRASDFAYPKDRAFPAHDCEHCDAAIKVLEGYKAPGVKDAIIAELNRRKASLKCQEEECPEGKKMVKGKCVPEKEEDDFDKIPMDQINVFIDAMAEALPGDDELLEVTDETEDLLDDEENAAKRPQDKPGGSNVGKHKTGPFCGPAGGAPKGSYPVNTKKRGIAALSYARHAPNPGGIKNCVCKHHPSLPACAKGKDMEDLHLQMVATLDEGTYIFNIKDDKVEVGSRCSGCDDLQGQLDAKDAQIEVHQDQLTVFGDDYQVLSEENVQLTQELSDRLADRVLELRIFGGEVIEDQEAARDEITAHDITVMRDTVGRLEDAFDFDSAALKLNDGMAREPEGTVDDPTVRVDGEEDQGQTPSKDDIMAIYNRVHATMGVKAAREFLDTVKSRYGKHLEFNDNHEEDNK